MRRSAQQGFTLVEMLIALMIFGMLTAAGVTLLTLTVRTQETSERLLGQLAEVRALSALLTADLGQAAPRIRRDRDGRRIAAFRGSAGDEAQLIVLTRRGWDEESESPHSALQRVEYRLAEGRLLRRVFTHVDGPARAVTQELLGGVRSVRLRYRDREGGWRENWDPTDPTLLPRAVELVTDDDVHGQIRQLFLVGGAR
ncbi:MAG TPA: type II secretion system minor pseudopilin GspJ [Allosphingosinicella sp.]|nr:type II secretion system minor pseudopilin GspJ [Allosphingosinicella sp.]